jgi:hypothetical protein
MAELKPTSQAHPGQPSVLKIAAPEALGSPVVARLGGSRA